MSNRNRSISSFAELGALKPESFIASKAIASEARAVDEIPDIDKSETGTLKIVLNRKVSLKRYPVIATVNFLRKRTDIAKLLSFVESKPQLIPARLNAFLNREGLIDGVALTEKGKEVQSSGLFESSERGLYHIWFTDDDPLLGSRPVMMQADTAFFDPGIEAWMKGVDAARSQFCLEPETKVQVLETEYQGKGTRLTLNTLSLATLTPEVICSPESSAKVEMSWQLDESGSLVQLTGQLDMFDFSNNKKLPKPEKLNLSIQHGAEHLASVMHDISKTLSGTWKPTIKRLALSEDRASQFTNAIQDFCIHKVPEFKLETEFGYFDCGAASIPVTPTDSTDAREWQRAWLEDYYSNGYRSAGKANSDQAQWLEHLAVDNFGLQFINRNSLFEMLPRTAAWHVAAIEDLSPSKGKKMRMPISLLNNDSLNLESLIAQLTGGDTVRQVIYSDRYVSTNKQQRNLNVLAGCLPGVTGLLLSLESINGKEITMPQGWILEGFQKEHYNHGRYWLFLTDAGPYCWECSIGLDFFHANGQADYVVAGTPGFTPKDVLELPRYLQDRLEEYNIGEAE